MTAFKKQEPTYKLNFKALFNLDIVKGALSITKVKHVQ